MFVRYGLALAGMGVAIGLGAAVGLMRLMKSLLFGISPLDPLTYAAVPVVLVAAAVLASYCQRGGGGGSRGSSEGGVTAKKQRGFGDAA